MFIKSMFWLTLYNSIIMICNKSRKPLIFKNTPDMNSKKCVIVIRPMFYEMFIGVNVTLICKLTCSTTNMDALVSIHKHVHFPRASH